MPVWVHLPLWACSDWFECLGTTSCSAYRWPQCLCRQGLDSTHFHSTKPAGPVRNVRNVAARNMLPLEVRSNCLWWSPYVIDGNDPPFSQQLQRLFVVVVIVHFVCIDEDKVKGFSLTSRQQIIWKKQEGTKTYVELICHAVVRLLLAISVPAAR